MDIASLKEIGLTDGEVKVYLALLKLGSSKTGKLAVSASVSSSKVYKILARLEKKGLASHGIIDGVAHYSAQQPKRILEYIDEEKIRLEEKRTAVEKILPQLQKQINSSIGAQANVFIGFKAVTNQLKEMLDELSVGDTYNVIGARYIADLPEQKRYFVKHHQRRVEKKIKVVMLANEDVRDSIIPDTKINSEIKYLPNYLMTDMQIFFYNNKSLLIVWSHEPIGFLIESEVVRKSFEKYFNAFWKIAKK